MRTVTLKNSFPSYETLCRCSSVLKNSQERRRTCLELLRHFGELETRLFRYDPGTTQPKRCEKRIALTINTGIQTHLTAFIRVTLFRISSSRFFSCHARQTSWSIGFERRSLSCS